MKTFQNEILNYYYYYCESRYPNPKRLLKINCTYYHNNSFFREPFTRFSKRIQISFLFLFSVVQSNFNIHHRKGKRLLIMLITYKMNLCSFYLFN